MQTNKRPCRLLSLIQQDCGEYILVHLRLDDVSKLSVLNSGFRQFFCQEIQANGISRLEEWKCYDKCLWIEETLELPECKMDKFMSPSSSSQIATSLKRAARAHKLALILCGGGFERQVHIDFKHVQKRQHFSLVRCPQEFFPYIKHKRRKDWAVNRRYISSWTIRNVLFPRGVIPQIDLIPTEPTPLHPSMRIVCENLTSTLKNLDLIKLSSSKEQKTQNPLQRLLDEGTFSNRCSIATGMERPKDSKVWCDGCDKSHAASNQLFENMEKAFASLRFESKLDGHSTTVNQFIESLSISHMQPLRRLLLQNSMHRLSQAVELFLTTSGLRVGPCQNEKLSFLKSLAFWIDYKGFTHQQCTTYDETKVLSENTSLLLIEGFKTSWRSEGCDHLLLQLVGKGATLWIKLTDRSNGPTIHF